MIYLKKSFGSNPLNLLKVIFSLVLPQKIMECTKIT